jgi:hypothetical protein
MFRDDFKTKNLLKSGSFINDPRPLKIWNYLRLFEGKIKSYLIFNAFLGLMF